MNIFPSHYCAPIPWFAAAIRQDILYIEQWEHYRKQQYSSRMHIKLSNRIFPLTIPVERRGRRMPMKEKRISYQEDWQRQHWNSLIAGYKNSPYFDYYADPLKACLDERYELLMDLHLAMLTVLMNWLGWEGSLNLTEEYLPSDHYSNDFRTAFDPSLQRLPDWFVPVEYPQVFAGFQPGLSILDLLFNEGPAARPLLLSSCQL